MFSQIRRIRNQPRLLTYWYGEGDNPPNGDALESNYLAALERGFYRFNLTQSLG